MLEILKFVRAAVTKNDLQPSFLHFKLDGGRVSATNGNLTISAPFPVDLACCPLAQPFIKAVAACDGPITLTLDKERLIVRSGRFRSAVNCCDPSRLEIPEPKGDYFPIEAPLLHVFERLVPFTSTDELRPWACGVLFANQSVYATNNISIVEHWLPFNFPVQANLPTLALKELIRLKLEPVGVQASPEDITFYLPGGAWMVCSLFVHKWPDVARIFEEGAKYSGAYLQGENLVEFLGEVKKIHAFTDEYDSIYFRPGEISTSRAGEPGTSIETAHAPDAGVYRTSQLAALSVVDMVGFGAYPGAIPFYGQNMRGVLTGLRTQ